MEKEIQTLRDSGIDLDVACSDMEEDQGGSLGSDSGSDVYQSAEEVD